MQLIPLGDSAVLVVLKAKTPVAALDDVGLLTASLNVSPLPGVSDIVPAYTTVTVHYDPAKVPAGAGSPVEQVMEWIKQLPPPPRALKKQQVAREVVIPVCYGGECGPDIATVAKHTNLPEAEVIRVHSKGAYRVAAVGFSPGFPYLLGMAARLATPRRETPRTVVAAGSVGIGGAQTGVYPSATPGGWMLVGRTPLRLFRPENQVDPTLLKAGDTVVFKPVSEKEAEKLQEKTTVLIPPKVSRLSAVIEVIKPGSLTTVQDLGRPGHQHHGVPVGGPMDRPAARVANLLLGNDENAPLLELTLTGPELKFLRDTWIAVTGAEVRGVSCWRPSRVKAGQVVSFAELTRGARAYVAFAGGLEVVSVLGGAGTLLRPGLGGWCGRVLQAGDRIGARPGIIDTKANWVASPEFNSTTIGGVTVRFLRGAQWDWFSAASRRAFLGKIYKTDAKSDRMGLRLKGAALRLEQAGRELLSEGVSFGSVQVPPDGQPIVLMADRQTIGGYPKIAQVISVDLPKLAQTRTGDEVRFQEITVEEAQKLYLEQEHSLSLFAAGALGKLNRA